MPAYSESRSLPYPPHLLFDLVADVERYPEFVPGWEAVRMIERRADGCLVEQTLGAGPLRLRFRAQARFERPAAIHIAAVDGPFRVMRVEWRFEPRGPGTLLHFHATAEAGGPAGLLLAATFARSAPHVLKAFLARAERLASTRTETRQPPP